MRRGNLSDELRLLPRDSRDARRRGRDADPTTAMAAANIELHDDQRDIELASSEIRRQHLSSRSGHHS